MSQGRQSTKGQEDKAGNNRPARLISLVKKSWDTTEGEWKRLKAKYKTRRDS